MAEAYLSSLNVGQVAYALRQAQRGTAIADVCRQLDVSEATFSLWKKNFAHLGVSKRRASAAVEISSGHCPAKEYGRIIPRSQKTTTLQKNAATALLGFLRLV
jgi:putative transposase